MNRERDPHLFTKLTAESIGFGAEVSKKIDAATFLGGLGIYILGFSALGSVLMIGTVLTWIPANELQRWSKKKLGK